jgi:homocysteine S-methyltransferase
MLVRMRLCRPGACSAFAQGMLEPMTAAQNPLAPFLQAQGAIVLDGGLATTLEEMGSQLDPKLWSAGLLRDDPDAVKAVHRAFLEAGADCIETVGYQASFLGYADLGIAESDATDLFDLSVQLAVEARDAFWSGLRGPNDRIRPLVAASVGPFGAYLADGSEYHGRYGVERAELDEFHRRRFQLLATSAAELIACETVPSRLEAEVLLDLISDTPDVWAWISFSCCDGEHISDGTPVAEVAALCEDVDRVAAIGVNCTAPEHVADLIDAIRPATTLPILAYPNSGEGYDAKRKTWVDGRSQADVATSAAGWIDRGAEGVGGCCRIGPDAIRLLRDRVVVSSG